MVAPFDFSTAGRILFGRGMAKQIAPAALEFGHNILLVSGKRTHPALLRLQTDLINAGCNVKRFEVPSEPTIELAEAGALFARDFGCEVVAGFGGGSSIDCAKAIAALATNPPPALQYLEVIGEGKPLQNAPLPIIAIPTTAGTGTEVTRNAVLASKQAGVKVSLRHTKMIPSLAIIDPELTLSLPPQVTAATGMDALTQLVEPYLSNGPNSITDALCLQGINAVGRSLRQAYNHPNDVGAREDMSLAALLSGIALANSKLGAVHGFAGPIGGMFGAPHGMLCARLLPFVFEENLLAMQHAGSAEYELRCANIGKALTGETSANATDALAWIKTTSEMLKIPSLAAYGITHNDNERICAAAKVASSMKGNPITLSETQMTHILEQAM